MTHTPTASTRRAWLAMLAATALPMAAGAAAPTPVEVWKDPHCGCCQDWVDHMQANGFAVERAGGLSGAALGRNREERRANVAPHGLMPMQATWACDRPISPQPFGQVPFREVCGVAALANSQAIGRAPRLASQPGKALARPRIGRQHVLVHDTGNNAVRARLGLPQKLGSCHTALVGGYLVEGHVPASDVHALLRQKPDALGLAVPGMPIGSPGMDGPAYGGRRDSYAVLLVARNGSTRVFTN